jgi:hypothetical protein
MKTRMLLAAVLLLLSSTLSHAAQSITQLYINSAYGTGPRNTILVATPPVGAIVQRAVVRWRWDVPFSQYQVAKASFDGVGVHPRGTGYNAVYLRPYVTADGNYNVAINTNSGWGVWFEILIQYQMPVRKRK